MSARQEYEEHKHEMTLQEMGRADAAIAELEAELCNVIRQWSDDYLDLVGYPVDVTELSALAQAVWADKKEAAE